MKKIKKERHFSNTVVEEENAHFHIHKEIYYDGVQIIVGKEDKAEFFPTIFPKSCFPVDHLTEFFFFLIIIRLIQFNSLTLYSMNTQFDASTTDSF